MAKQKKNNDNRLFKCNQLNIDIAKDPDWKVTNGKTDLSDPDDIYSYMNMKTGSNSTWFSLEQQGEYNSFLVVSQEPKTIIKWIKELKAGLISDKEFKELLTDQGKSPLLTIHLYDSRDKKSLEELKKATPLSYQQFDVDIANDPDWKDSQEKDITLDDYYDPEGFIHAKFGNDIDWVSLEEEKADTYLIIDQAPDKNGRSPSLKIVTLIDSREKENNYIR